MLRRFTGTLNTLTLNVKVKLLPNDKASENAPDYRLQVVGGAEIGCRVEETSQADRHYLSVTLDDPSFATAIYARLLEGEDGTHALIWTRNKGE